MAENKPSSVKALQYRNRRAGHVVVFYIRQVRVPHFLRQSPGRGAAAACPELRYDRVMIYKGVAAERYRAVHGVAITVVKPASGAVYIDKSVPPVGIAAGEFETRYARRGSYRYRVIISDRSADYRCPRSGALQDYGFIHADRGRPGKTACGDRNRVTGACRAYLRVHVRSGPVARVRVRVDNSDK
jgi:hypothetical protein